MNVQLEDLITKVTAIEDVGDSAIVLLNGLKAKLDEAIAANDMTGVQEVSDRIAAQTQELADAIAANTPAEPPVEEPAV